LKWAKSVEQIVLPGFGAVEPWQFTFIVVGLPGLFLAVIFFFINEPPRQPIGKDPKAAEGDNLLSMLSHVFTEWKLFFPFLAMFSFMTIIAYSQGWGAPLFKRTWGWEAYQYATYNAIVTLIVGPLAVNFAGWLSDKWTAVGIKDAPIRIAQIGIVIIIITGVIFPLLPSPYMAIFVIGFNTAGIAMVSAVGITALLNISPVRMRAQIVAFYYMCISLAGLFIGPPMIAILNDFVYGEMGIRYSMAILPALFGLPILLLYRHIRSSYIQSYDYYESIGQE